MYLSGLQALVRLPLDQSRRDRKAGIRTGTFISGYPGSPLGGYDLALQHASPLLQQHDIVHVPAGNEELAATAISGTQMLDAYPHSRVDGVVALWYGMVELLASWSSPLRTTTAPCRLVPAKLPCFSASPLRSTPGPLPYQSATTPSTRECG